MFFKKKSHTLGDDSKNWYKDKYEYVRQQRDLLLVITLVSLGCAAASGLVVMWITPYKSVEPFVIQIDEKTGIVQRVDPVQRTEFTANEAIDRYFLATYIRARESYIPSVFVQNYNLVRVMSDPSAFGSYRRAISLSNPESPAALMKGEGTRMVTFKNITFVSRNEDVMRASKVALARILLTDKRNRGGQVREYHSVVTVNFQYANLNLNEEERFLNPLGFLVTDYQIEREVIQ